MAGARRTGLMAWAGLGLQIAVTGISSRPRQAQGGHYPDDIFEAVIFPRNAGAFGGVNGYVGNRVQISGPVQLYHGKPEITLTNLGQIQVINASHGQKLTA
jgi:hypothetical protein